MYSIIYYTIHFLTSRRSDTWGLLSLDPDNIILYINARITTQNITQILCRLSLGSQNAVIAIGKKGSQTRSKFKQQEQIPRNHDAHWERAQSQLTYRRQTSELLREDTMTATYKKHAHYEIRHDKSSPSVVVFSHILKSFTNCMRQSYQVSDRSRTDIRTNSTVTRTHHFLHSSINKRR